MTPATKRIVHIVIIGLCAAVQAIAPSFGTNPIAALYLPLLIQVLTGLNGTVFVDSVGQSARASLAAKVAAKITGALAMVLVVSVAACSLFKSGTTTTTVVGDVGQLAACVLQHVESDTDPTVESVAAECSPIAAADVVAILAALEAGPTTDAGAAKVSPSGLVKAHRALVAYREAH